MKRLQAVAITTAIILASIIATPLLNSQGIIDFNRAGCGSCHSGFTAFTITIDAPTEVPTGHEFQYKAKVKNSGSHEVHDLKAKITLDESRTFTLPQENASKHLTKVLKLCGYQNSYKLVINVYTSQALDPHVERERLREGLWS